MLPDENPTTRKESGSKLLEFEKQLVSGRFERRVATCSGICAPLRGDHKPSLPAPVWRLIMRGRKDKRKQDITPMLNIPPRDREGL